MIKAILWSVAVVFCALGICDFIHTVRSMLLYPDVKTNRYCVIFLRRGHAICQLKYYSFKLRWFGAEFCDCLIAVTDNLFETEIAACERFCYGSSIHLCRFGNLDTLINRFEVGETDEERLNP
ncbi:MAG: hypothetical protein IK086_03145 [Clostridia bacterium]|nr:hypothetical protein [Clostridia bacterium]